MARFALLLALASLSAANFTGFYIQRGLYEMDGDDQKPLSSRPVCNAFQVSCGSFCIPKAAPCCQPDVGSYCEPGRYCTSGGCCPEGETCSGEADRCEPEYELDDTSSCVPAGAVSCGDGTYCDASETCTKRGTCAIGDDKPIDDTETLNMMWPRKSGKSSGGHTGTSSSSDATSLDSRAALGIALGVLLVL